MSSNASEICLECGAAIDASLLGGVCPRCLLGEVMAGHGKTEDASDEHEILGEIARGGMGVVYRARQREPERVVALKTLRTAALDSPEALARFKHEVEVMVALDHPAILPVYQTGELDGIPFFTMKLVEGGTLAARVGSYEGRWREIAALMATICDAVRHAHERGVLHRDLKPANILFDAEDRPYVSDFGIAKLADASGAAGLTMTLSLIGTPHYLAPEVAIGNAKAASVLSDVWSLGVMLYELLTGEKPFNGESATMVLRALDVAEPQSPRKLRPGIPRDLEVITLKALSREPGRRYPTANDLAGDLRAWLDGRPISARPVPGMERAWLWSRRNPRLAAALAMLCLAVLTAVAALVWGFVRVRQENERVMASEEKTRAQLRDSLLHQAQAGRSARLAGWRESGLRALQEANGIKPGEDLRDEAIAHLAGVDLAIDRETTWQGNIYPSPSFDRYVMQGADGTVVLQDTASRRTIRVLGRFADDVLLDAMLDAGGKWAALGFKRAGVRVIAQDSGRELTLRKGWELHDVSADGGALILRSQRDLILLSTDDWRDAGRLPTGNMNPAISAICQAEGAKLAALNPAFQMIQLHDWSSGQKVGEVKPLGISSRMDWRENWLAAGLSGGQVQVFDLRSGATRVLSRSLGPCQWLRFSKEGPLLLTTSLNGVTCIWHPATGENLVRADGIRLSRLSADGTRALGADGMRRLCEIRRSAGFRLLSSSAVRGVANGGNIAADVSPDGRLIVLCDHAQMSVHDSASGEMLATQRVSVSPGALFSISFSADGRQLLIPIRQGMLVNELAAERGQLKFTGPGKIIEVANQNITERLHTADRDTILLQDLDGLFHLARMNSLDRWQRIESKRRFAQGLSGLSVDGQWLCGSPLGSRFEVQQTGDPASSRILDEAIFGLPAFSPDGRWMAVVGKNKGALVYEVDGWKLRHRPPLSASTASSLTPVCAWAPHSQWVAYAVNGTEVELLEAGTWRVLMRLQGPIEMPIAALQALPDGSGLLVTRDLGVIEKWDLHTLSAELSAWGIEARLPATCQPSPSPADFGKPFKPIPPPMHLMQWQRGQ